MTSCLNDPHKNFTAALVFLLKSPSNLASFSQTFGPGIGSPATTLTLVYFCAEAGFSSDIVIRRKVLFSRNSEKIGEEVRENEMRTEQHRIEEMRRE
jgi:hypothetical protein